MAEISGGELLLKCLHAERVRHLFAIPDGTYNIALEALQRRGDEWGCELIVPRHEAAAAHMADAYTRVTGGPAVVMACAGPGAANLVSGVITAQAEGSPVVAITTTRRSDIAHPHRAAMQVADQLAYYKPVVKWNAGVHDWGRIPDLVRQAFRVATSGRPGPVHLDIPENLLMARGEEESAPVWERDLYRAAQTSVPEPTLIQRAAEMLVGAALPNLHCGGGALRSGAHDELRALAEHLGGPVTTGVDGRGTIPEDHALSVHPLCPAAAMVHQGADVVLAVGTRFGELDFWGRAPVWRPRPGRGCQAHPGTACRGGEVVVGPARAPRAYGRVSASPGGMEAEARC
jgi:acetolactate synthase-1/2/3 large subunit